MARSFRRRRCCVSQYEDLVHDVMSVAFSDFMRVTHRAGSYDPIRMSEDGGKTFKATVSYYGGVHPDNHALWIDPNDPNFIINGKSIQSLLIIWIDKL